jgi:protein tyrosine/serine phosphatase
MLASRAFHRVLVAAILLATMALPLRTAERAKSAENDRQWAAKIDKPGLPNLHKVDDTLYRGAQPTAAGFKSLEMMGVKTIINLRSEHSDKDKIGDANLTAEHIPMKAWTPTEDQAVQFLRLVAGKGRGPVFVHCQHGADRTGVMCAIYRVAVNGWTKKEAIQEMTKGGFGFHPIWVNLPKFVETLDIEAVKKKAGIKP